MDDPVITDEEAQALVDFIKAFSDYQDATRAPLSDLPDAAKERS